MKCPVCHLDNQDDARFCCHCGNVISGESLAVSITDAAKIIGCTTQTILNLIDRGYLTLMGADAHRKTYVSRESLLRFCNVIPDFKGKITVLRKLYSQVSKAQEILDTQVSQMNTDMLFSQISIRKNIVLLMMNFCLKGREKQILYKFLFEHKTLDELAKEWDITRERVRQIKENAIKKLSAETLPENIIFELQQYDINHSIENEHNENDEDEDKEDDEEDIIYDEDDEDDEEVVFYDEDDRALNSIIKHGKIQGIRKK